MNKTVILQADNISKSYVQADGTPLRILKSFSAQLNTGEIVALVGPSGSGKSTLLHILGLLDKADGGILSMNGVDVLSLSDTQRTKIRRNDIGFVYQFHHLLPEFSALENIMLPQIINGVSKAEAEKRARDLLDAMKLSNRADNRPAKLSGGEQQRVAIARALANKPKILLADEPTGNLDPETGKIVFDMFMELARDSGIAALIATHNMDLANQMDREIAF
jgi:lipoprotein-releasing system ATP-binding protein